MEQSKPVYKDVAKCEGCGKVKPLSEFSIIGGNCDDCLADGAADENNSFHTGEY